MQNNFGFAQGDDGTTRYARVKVPGCGRREKDDAPIVMVEIRKSGEITLQVYADIKSSEATHEIPLNGARLELKEADMETVAEKENEPAKEKAHG